MNIFKILKVAFALAAALCLPFFVVLLTGRPAPDPLFRAGEIPEPLSAFLFAAAGLWLLRQKPPPRP